MTSCGGGGGSDTYVFNRGDGQDTIAEGDYSYATQVTLKFGAGIAATDLTWNLSGSVLTLGIQGTTDTVTTLGWNRNWTWWGSPGSNFVDRIEFADGTVLGTLALQLRVDAIPIVGTSGNDVLYGTLGDNIFQGGAGNDLLKGGSGNDLYL